MGKYTLILIRALSFSKYFHNYFYYLLLYLYDKNFFIKMIYIKILNKYKYKFFFIFVILNFIAKIIFMTIMLILKTKYMKLKENVI